MLGVGGRIDEVRDDSAERALDLTDRRRGVFDHVMKPGSSDHFRVLRHGRDPLGERSQMNVVGLLRLS